MDKRNEKILAFYRRHRRMPSYSEIMKLLGYRSKNSVHYFVEKSVKAGIIDKDRSGRLIPKSTQDSGARLLGLVEAGFPAPAEEELLDVMNFDEYLVPNKESTYILKVKGDSM